MQVSGINTNLKGTFEYYSSGQRRTINTLQCKYELIMLLCKWIVFIGSSLQVKKDKLKPHRSAQQRLSTRSTEQTLPVGQNKINIQYREHQQDMQTETILSVQKQVLSQPIKHVQQAIKLCFHTSPRTYHCELLTTCEIFRCGVSILAGNLWQNDGMIYIIFWGK